MHPHVLAAGIRSSAEVIVTYNLKDFPAETLAKFDLEAQHPDDFLLSLFDLAPGQSVQRSNVSGKACATHPKQPRKTSPRSKTRA